MAVLHTHEFGDPTGAPLLAVHGITAHGRRFRRLGDERWSDRRTVAVDLRGHGRSTFDGPWNIQQHVDDLVDTLDAHTLQEVDVVGHSYGGAITLALLARAPERVRSIALLDPALMIGADTADVAAMGIIADQGFATVDDAVAFRTGGDERLAETAAAEVADHLVEGDDGRYRFRFHRPAAIAGWGEMCAPLPAHVEPRPALLAVAAQAPFVTPEVEALLAGLFGDHLATVRLDCGHLLYWERFDETATVVREFLASVRERHTRPGSAPSHRSVTRRTGPSHGFRAW